MHTYVLAVDSMVGVELQWLLWASGGMADARGLGPRGVTLAGSSPVSPTIPSQFPKLAANIVSKRLFDVAGQRRPPYEGADNHQHQRKQHGKIKHINPGANGSPTVAPPHAGTPFQKDEENYSRTRDG